MTVQRLIEVVSKNNTYLVSSSIFKNMMLPNPFLHFKIKCMCFNFKFRVYGRYLQYIYTDFSFKTTPTIYVGYCDTKLGILSCVVTEPLMHNGNRKNPQGQYFERLYVPYFTTHNQVFKHFINIAMKMFIVE